jgi:hypothetical protein
MYNNTTGAYNAAVGRGALYSNTTGSYNCAIGSYSLYYNTTGINNVALGSPSSTNSGDPVLYRNTTGSQNIGIGPAAVFNNTTGNYNIGIGYQSMYSTTSASYLIAIGYQAAYAATLSGNSVFIGHQAGFLGNGDYGYNTVVGFKAGFSLNNVNGGWGNTFIGCNAQNGLGAGFWVTSGVQNTILGGFDGNQGGLDIRTASNRIVLSDGAGNPRLHCNSSGQWCINKATPSIGANSIMLAIYAPTPYTGIGGFGVQCGEDTTGGIIGTFSNSSNTKIGSITVTGSGTGVAYNTSSDYRLKDITGPMTGALERNRLLEPEIGTWKLNGDPFEGFVAHKLQRVFPHAVTGEKDAVDKNGNPVYQAVGTGPLDAHFAACINELMNEIASLRSEIAILKGN